MKRLVGAIAVFALCACSASTHSGIVPGTGASKATATVTIHWAASTSSAARAMSLRKRPQFISPSAQSIGIEVSPVGSTDPSQRVTTTVNKPASGALTSTVTFDAPSGNDDILFAEFDQPNLGGNQLGGAEVFQTINAGQTNTVNATLSGYVGSVKVNTTGGVATGQDFTGQPIYSLVGAIPMTVVLTLLDADGNAIIAPGTAPIAQITSTNPSLFTVTAVPNAPDSFTVRKISPWADIGITHPWIPTETKYLALNISVASGADGAQRYQTSFSVSGIPAVYATSGVGGARMSVFQEDGTPVTLPGPFAGLNQPIAMTYDQDDNRIYVADGASNTIQAFGGDGSAVTGWTPPTVPGINSLAYDSVTKTLLAGSNGATPLTGFDATGSPVTVGPFAGVGTVVGIAYEREDIPGGAGICPFRAQVACGDYYVVYSSGGTYYNAAFDDFGRPDALLPPAVLSSPFVPSAVGSTQVPNSTLLLTGTYAGSTVACVMPVGGSLTVSASNCIQSGITSPTSITGDDYGTGTPRFWIAGAPSGLTYATYDAPGSMGLAPQINTSIAYPTPSGASNFTNVLLVY